MAPGYSQEGEYRFSLSSYPHPSITLLSPRDLFIFYLFVGPPILRTLFAVAFLSLWNRLALFPNTANKYLFMYSSRVVIGVVLLCLINKNIIIIIVIKTSDIAYLKKTTCIMDILDMEAYINNKVNSYVFQFINFVFIQLWVLDNWNAKFEREKSLAQIHNVL